MAQAVELLLCKFKALSSNPSNNKTKNFLLSLVVHTYNASSWDTEAGI
jgi:hypothetical protein